MCGIAGLVDFGKNSNVGILKKMTDILFNRGPDDGGYFFEGFKQSQVGLGHRRLSIMDLSNHGHQPMAFNHLTMVYNGEVYNFKEIREELEKKGYRFQSHSDTEVILKAYHQWGVEAVHRFNGMFAISIFDSQAQTLTLIRDRAGVKPLYWYQKDSLFMFASEIKSFHEHPAFVKQLNPDGLALYLQYGYIPQPHTIFNHTHKLEAGSILILDTINGSIKIEKYWDVIDCYNKPKINISEQEAIQETESFLKSACEYRMIADVPVGVFLSGGYDSSVVTALLQSNRTERIKTYSIGFNEEKFNEAPHAKKVANYLGTNHTEYYCTAQDASDILHTLPQIYDEPFSDNSSIPTILVSKIAKQDVTVSLSADGGDELFGGYDKYVQTERLNRYISKIPFSPVIGKVLGSVNPSNIPLARYINKFDHRYHKISQSFLCKNPIELMSLISNIFTPREVRSLLLTDIAEPNTSFNNVELLRKDLNVFDKMLAIDYKTFQVDDILNKVDKATMSVSLEGREPLLDYRLVEYVSSLSPEFKIKNGDKKYILKEITHKYIPKEIMDRPKMGFSTPIISWFQNELRDYLIDYFDEDFLTEQKIFNVKAVRSLRDEYFSGKSDNIHKIWAIIVFQLWYFKWLK